MSARIKLFCLLLTFVLSYPLVLLMGVSVGSQNVFG